MTIKQAIVQRLVYLPEATQREILDFIEFLEIRQANQTAIREDRDWSLFSLASAMREMEAEESPYTLTDIKESFR
ncbi:MAG: hypothetical protein QME74_04050 [Candidatus Edwardsbacteria bacterium]|nr:hypothetical protein [Candidatus Edwardsbacteria bacterium]